MATDAIEIEKFNKRVDSFLVSTPTTNKPVKDDDVTLNVPATTKETSKCLGVECVCNTTVTNELGKCTRRCQECCGECTRQCAMCLQRECPLVSTACVCSNGWQFVFWFTLFAFCIYGIVVSNEPLKECRDLTRGERYVCMSDAKSDVALFAFANSMLIFTFFNLIHLILNLSCSPCRKQKQYPAPPQCVNGCPNKTLLLILLPKLSLLFMTVMMFALIYSSQFGGTASAFGTVFSIFGMVLGFYGYVCGIYYNIE